MARRSATKTSLPAPLQRSLKQLGADLAVARKRRRIPMRLMAERMLVSLQTVQRLEAGEASVSLGALASALFALGLAQRLEQLASPESDLIGQREELTRLPQRSRTPAVDEDLDF